MKKIILILNILLCYASYGQEYTFIPENLRLLPIEELAKKEPPEDFEPVYYEDGTKVAFKEVLPLIMEQKLRPLMFVDNDGNYKALVVKTLIKNEDIRIAYENIPKSLEKLGHSFGNPNSDKVIINMDGGPINNLRTYRFESRYNVLGGIDESKYFLINMRESQTLHPEETEKEEISLEQAKKYNEKTTKTLFELISYFKSQNKKVYVVGGSYGSFVGLKSIVDYKNIADGYLLMVGRLDMNEEVWKPYSKGIEAKFEEDGITVKFGKKSENVYTVNMRKIAAEISIDRYTKLLENANLSNLTYIYIENDQSVGRLTENEIKFLESKNANVVSVKGNHGNFYEHLKKGLQLLLNN